MEPDIKVKAEDSADEEKSDPNVTGYVKRLVLDAFKESGCTRETLVTTACYRRQDPQPIIDYMIRSSKNAQKRVNVECESLSLKNINEWLELLNSTDLPNHCEYEAAAVMNAIARNEPHPQPEEVNGLNMAEVYGFLENALAGKPQQKLNAASQAFIAQEFQLLLAELNTNECDSAARRMGQIMFDRQEYDYAKEPHKCSLDPLFLDNSQ